MRKLEIDEWIVRLVKVMHDGANSRVSVNGCFSERFEVTVGVHQSSVLSLLLSCCCGSSLLWVSLLALGNSYMQMVLPS